MEEIRKAELEHARKRESEQAKHGAKIAWLKEEEMELANWDTELNYQLSLVDKYGKIKDRLPVDVIRKKFPEFADFIVERNNE